jgi:hypothetical protein
MFVFAQNPDLFNAAEVARFMRVDRNTAMADLREVVDLDPAKVYK